MMRMRSPCELIAKYVLPVFRALVAKELLETYSFSQNEVAEKLGITQAAVSHYINSKRGAVMMSELEKIPGVKETVTDVSKSLAGKSGSDEMILAFCRLCSVVKSQKAFWDNFEKLRKPL
ncbi:MAG: helix-turn-helix domain-containing protein [Candidatus Verstraetearchaeota archaeon]|nr:helix-turn-helix domain-containing protein [Candidatus Verstraetearchaeota archaeon]